MRVVLVDDHKLVREALCTVLEREPDIVVSGQAWDGESALELCRELRPDLVLMDIGLPDISGIDVTRRLLTEIPAIRVLAVSTFIDRRFVESMLEAGASGYIHKAAGRDELLKGIRAVASGTRYVSKNVAAMLVRNPAGHDAGGASTRLGKRETEVLMLIADGRKSAQIAEKLHIAAGTVEVHRYNIMRKLDLHNVAELTKYAIREGLIST